MVNRCATIQSHVLVRIQSPLVKMAAKLKSKQTGSLYRKSTRIVISPRFFLFVFSIAQVDINAQEKIKGKSSTCEF